MNKGIGFVVGMLVAGVGCGPESYHTASVSESQSAQQVISAAQSIKSSVSQGNIPSLSAMAGLGASASMDSIEQPSDSCVTRQTNGAKTTLTLNCTSGADSEKGSITVNGDSIDLDLHVTGSVTLDETGHLTVSSNAIDGNLSIAVQSADASGQKLSASVMLTFSQITLDGSGCPTGGELASSATVSDGRSESSSFQVKFGPACGNVQVAD